MDSTGLKDIKSDVKEIKRVLLELVKQGAVNTQTLIEHERRSTNLETRISPLEKELFLLKRVSYLLTSGTALSILYSVIKSALH